MTGCDRILPLETGKPISSRLLGLSMIGYLYGGYSCQQMKQFLSATSLFQFQYTPKAGDLGVKFTASLSGSGNNWGIYARANDTVVFTGGQWDPYVPDIYDYSRTANSADAVLVLDATSKPPFDPSATYTFVISSQNCDSNQLKVEAEPIVAVPDAGPEAGPVKDAAPDTGKPKEAGVDGAPNLDFDEAELGGGACGCRTGSAAPARSLWLIALLAAWAAGRRRRAPAA
jgi:MYXO-CTERM domain-containing protein